MLFSFGCSWSLEESKREQLRPTSTSRLSPVIGGIATPEPTANEGGMEGLRLGRQLMSFLRRGNRRHGTWMCFSVFVGTRRRDIHLSKTQV